MRFGTAFWEVLLLVEMVRGPFFEFPSTLATTTTTTTTTAVHRSRSPAGMGRSRRTSPHRVAHVKHSLESELAQHKPSADYWWKSQVDDPKRGFSQGRTEFRRGNTVFGQYQYSDGHVRVRVIYKADQNGFRVLKEERTPLKPVVNTLPSDNSIAIPRKITLKRNSVPVRTP